MKRWLELRTAYQVAKHGKVTEAAEALGVHRATVNRHIDALEADLGVRLFLRHGQGYALTEIGEDFLLVAQRAEEMFTDFFGRTELAEGGLTGEVILTAPLAISGVFATPILRFQTEHPEIRVKLIAEDGLAKLEYGEAHVALRGGSKPEEPDYVVQRFTGVRLELYAHTSYVARMGMPQSPVS